MGDTTRKQGDLGFGGEGQVEERSGGGGGGGG